MSVVDDQVNEPREIEYPRPWYAWFVVFVLMTCAVVSYLDRTILTLLVEPIKRDLGFTDTQVSLLHGLAFALFFTICGLPIGRQVDRRSRVGIIFAGVSIWTAMTAICGVVQSYWALFLARMGVGVGEASLNPSAASLIADYFPESTISRATSVYVMGNSVGVGIAYVVGGTLVGFLSSQPDLHVPVIGHLHAWQTAFFYAALPGIPLLLLLRTVREPKRTKLMHTSAEAAKGISIRELAEFVRLNNKTLTAHAVGFGLISLTSMGIGLWAPTFLVRTFGWSIADAGITFGLIVGIAGGCGVFAGGAIADRVDRLGRLGGPIITAATAAALSVPFAAAFPLVSSAQLSVALMAVMLFLGGLPWGVAISAIQQISPNEYRGQLVAGYMFVVNLLGIGLGPTAIALLTDYVYGDPLDLRYSISVVASAATLSAAVLLFWGLRHFRGSLERAAEW